MINIHKAITPQFYVTISANNGEVLSTSELFESKQSAFKNIHALCVAFRTPSKQPIKLIDHTGKKKAYYIYLHTSKDYETVKVSKVEFDKY